MDFFRQADEAPVIRLMNSGELEILARKLPQDELAAHFSEDAGMAETVIARPFPWHGGRGGEGCGTVRRCIPDSFCCNDLWA